MLENKKAAAKTDSSRSAAIRGAWCAAGRGCLSQVQALPNLFPVDGPRRQDPRRTEGELVKEFEVRQACGVIPIADLLTQLRNGISQPFEAGDAAL